MAFRGFEPGGPEFLRDPLARFCALDEAFEADRTPLAHRAPQRLAAVNLVLTPGEPAEVAASVRRLAERVVARAGFGRPHPLFQLILGAIMLRHDDSPDLLVDEINRVRPLMRRVGLRWSPSFELIAIVALRVQTRGPIAYEQIDRMREIYEAMKVHHWWLTGPDDFPACALLSGRPESATVLADRAHAIYELMHNELDLTRGDSLQTVSNLLALADAAPGDLVQRYGALIEDFSRAAHSPLLHDRSNELALLCFLPRSTASVVATVVEYDDAMREHIKWYERQLSFTFAANLAFVHIVGNDPELGPLADVKALLDMFWIIAQQG